jgi:hypothetical protein
MSIIRITKQDLEKAKIARGKKCKEDPAFKAFIDHMKKREKEVAEHQEKVAK